MAFFKSRPTLIATGALGLLVLIASGSARADASSSCSCPTQDKAGHPLVEELTAPGDSGVSCLYKTPSGDALCDYARRTGNLIGDSDSGSCPDSISPCP